MEYENVPFSDGPTAASTSSIPHIKQYVPLNSDNDNGTALYKFGNTQLTQYVPQGYAYDFTKSDYLGEDDLIDLEEVMIDPPLDWATK